MSIVKSTIAALAVTGLMTGAALAENNETAYPDPLRSGDSVG